MTPQRSALLWARLIFFAACAIGMIIQLTAMARLYFSYKVTTTIDISIPDTIQPQALSFCTRYTDIMDYERLNNETGRNWEYTMDHLKVKKYQKELTLAEIFKFTPNITLKETRFRKSDTYDITMILGPAANEHVIVHKYVYLEYMCYKIMQKDLEQQSYDFYSETIAMPGFAWGVWIDLDNITDSNRHDKQNPLARAEIVKFTIHDVRTYPYRSLKSVPGLGRRYDHGVRVAHYNMFQSSKVELRSNLLPTPYESDCFDYSENGFHDEVHCRQECVRNKMKKRFNKVPFSIIMNVSTDDHIAAFDDIVNPDFVRGWKQMSAECANFTCRRTSCVTVTDLTKTIFMAIRNLRLWVMTPAEPWININARIAMNLVEFLTYVMGTIGTWTGITFVTLEPKQLYRIARKTNVIAKTDARTRFSV